MGRMASIAVVVHNTYQHLLIILAIVDFLSTPYCLLHKNYHILYLVAIVNCTQGGLATASFKDVVILPAEHYQHKSRCFGRGSATTTVELNASWHY